MLPKVLIWSKDREFKLFGFAKEVLAEGEERPVPHIHDIARTWIAIHTCHDVNERLDGKQVVKGSSPKLDNLLSIRRAPLREDHKRRSFSLEAELLAVQYLFKNCFPIVLV